MISIEAENEAKNWKYLNRSLKLMQKIEDFVKIDAKFTKYLKSSLEWCRNLKLQNGWINYILKWCEILTIQRCREKMQKFK